MPLMKRISASAIATIIAALLLVTIDHFDATRAAASVLVDVETRAAAVADPRNRLARIQSNLERVAAKQSRWPTAPGTETETDTAALEKIVDAYALYLKGDFPAMDSVLAQISKTTAARRSNIAKPTDPTFTKESSARRSAYYAALDAAASRKSSLLRLFAGLRKVDATLFLKAVQSEFADIHERTRYQSFATAPSGLDGMWLRLPCRTLIGRTAQFSADAVEMRALGGPSLACPVDSTDFAEIEALAKAPENLAPHRVLKRAPTTAAEEPVSLAHWIRETAVAHMDSYPALAEIVLAGAAQVDAVGKLDYLLFLHALRPADLIRDATINRLLGAVRAIPTPDDACCGEPVDEDRVNYDGSDESLVPTIVWASSSGVANTQSAFYAIPCAVLAARPKLLEAIKERYGSNRDNFLPRSGCSWGRGSVSGFPDALLEDFVTLAEQADGHFIDHLDGSMRFGLMTEQTAAWERMRLDPRALLTTTESPLAYPYQVWGMLSLDNHAIALKTKAAYEIFHDRLAMFYRDRGLGPQDSARAAKAGIFAAVWGADCGGDVPQKSLHRALVEGSPVGDLIAASADADPAEAPEIIACETMDPAMLVAVANPAALAALLDRNDDADTRNAFGKTALMVAAQFDSIASAQVLLAHGAHINTTTLQTGQSFEITLSHDARSALMYAAANGSSAMIRLLLDAGADPFQADSKGMRAVDYLLGFGPNAANTHLDAQQKAEALRLLF
jgi:hypothetical protein